MPDRDGFATSGEWNFHIGRLGEKLAARHVRRHCAFKILYRNFKGPNGGEVDLICRDRKASVLAFIEVKTRTTAAYGRPIEAVNRAKRDLISRGALAWLRKLPAPHRVRFRFDVAEVMLEDGKPPKIELVRDVFQLPAGVRY